MVSEEHSGLRLDKFLSLTNAIASRSRAAQLIEAGRVRWAKSSSTVAPKASYKVRPGDEFDIDVPDDAADQHLEPWDLPLEIFYQDNDCAVINKPAGLVVHPAAGHAQDTLVNALIHHLTHLSMGFAEKRPGIVHRLDKDTSGILVVAKNDFAHEALSKQFKEKSVHRIYWALVYGQPSKKEGTIISNLGRHPTNRKKFCSREQGKRAVTHYKVLRASHHISLLQCRLETGRTHQIRVHLSEMGHPIVADRIYGSSRWIKILPQRLRQLVEDLPRIGLHACELGFTHPHSNERLTFKADWPADLQPLVKELGFDEISAKNSPT